MMQTTPSLNRMTPRERLLATYRRQTTDCVASLADLSYWHAGNGGGKFIPGKTDGANREKVEDLLKLHRKTGSAIHVNLGTFYRERLDGDIRVDSGIRGETYYHRFETPMGSVEERREWSDASFSWPIVHHMVQSVEDLKIIRYIFEHTNYEPNWDLFHEVDRQVGEWGVPLVPVPYTGMGFLMSRYLGLEQTIFLAIDEPEEIEATVKTINENHKKAFECMVDGPSEVMFNSDNLSADIQNPPWFNKYSGDHYRWMAETAHAAGKPLVTHIDGRLRGLLKTAAEVGVDAADAVTPAPHGDLSPQECRDEAGNRLTLSGGVPPSFFHPEFPLKQFDESVEKWLALAEQSSALIIAPGDQLPPDGELDRVTRMVEMANAKKY